jgi:glycosyltransferase involved in cell wall biosynthesis
MRVLVLTTSFPTDKKSLAGIFILDECTRLAEQGVEVTVLAPHHPGSKRSESIGGIKVRRFRYMLPSHWQRLCYRAGMEPNMHEGFLVRVQLAPFFLVFFLYAIWFSRKTDIVHCHWSPAGLVGAVAGKYILRKPIVYMEHHGTVTTSRLHRFFLRWILRNVDCVLANSSFTLNRILKLSKPKRYEILPPAIDMSRFSARERTDEFLQKLGFKRDIPLLLSVGRFIDCKGFSYLIEAIEFLVHDMGRPDTQLLIVGDGPLRSSLERMIYEKGLERNIHIVGIIPPEDMPRFYSHADILIAPSIVDDQGNTEGLGLTLLEANACGVPCIGSRVGGIVDIIKEGQNGFLVDEKNPRQIAQRIDFLLSHPQKRSEMGLTGRLMVQEKYESALLTGRLLGTYTKVLSAGRRYE